MTPTIEETLVKTSFNSILLRRKNKIAISEDSINNENYGVLNSNHVKAIALNIASLGYCFTPKLIKQLETLNIVTLTEFNNFIVGELTNMVGANVTYKPLFRNFPEDVPNVWDYTLDRIIGHLESIFDLTENAKLLSCGHLINTEAFDMSNFGACPICQMRINDNELLPSKERSKLKTKIKLKTIDFGYENDILDLFKNLISSKTSISESDVEDITDIFVDNKDSIVNYIPNEIPHKEVLALISSLTLKHLDNFDFLKDRIKTSTDVLRIATALSDGDVSLANNTKFNKFKRKERKFLLTMLENCNNITEDMLRYKNNWIRLGEILHPGEFKKCFPKSFQAFSVLRNNEKFKTFNSNSESYIKVKNFVGLTKHLTQRPSELARRLDFILSNVNDIQSVITIFKTCVDKVSTTVLLQVMSNFKIRSTDDKNIRIIMPKGSLAKVKVLDETRPTIPSEISTNVINVIKDELTIRFGKLDKLGNVYLDENLKDYMVPASQRSASKALITIPRGSQVKMTNDNTIRMFCYWKEPKNIRTDVDLSAVMFDKDWNKTAHISFTNYEGDGCTHSGDIQSAPKGAAEFIDINKSTCLENGVRYIAMNIYAFTEQPFVEMPECFAGIMGRKSSKSGEIFEPKTVKQKFDVGADTCCAIPLILDLVENKMIWCDLSLKSNARRSIMIESNVNNVRLMCKALSKFVDFKTTIYELLELHIKARGILVENKKDADLVFSEKTIPTQLDDIMANYLS